MRDGYLGRFLGSAGFLCARLHSVFGRFYGVVPLGFRNVGINEYLGELDLVSFGELWKGKYL